MEQEFAVNEDRGKKLSLDGLLQMLRLRRRPEQQRWQRDGLGMVFDGPGLVSLSLTADGPIGTIARIELNGLRGLPLEDGLPEDALNQPGAP